MFKAQELRTFLRDNGANVPEESKTPLQDELEELIGACDLCFKSEAGMFPRMRGMDYGNHNMVACINTLFDAV